MIVSWTTGVSFSEEIALCNVFLFINSDENREKSL